jgi:hypothetical protein
MAYLPMGNTVQASAMPDGPTSSSCEESRKIRPPKVAHTTKWSLARTQILRQAVATTEK